jgi:hypothetical protein
LATCAEPLMRSTRTAYVHGWQWQQGGPSMGYSQKKDVTWSAWLPDDERGVAGLPDRHASAQQGPPWQAVRRPAGLPSLRALGGCGQKRRHCLAAWSTSGNSWHSSSSWTRVKITLCRCWISSRRMAPILFDSDWDWGTWAWGQRICMENGGTLSPI